MTHGRTITESDVTAFASLTGDHHPQHVDAEWAAGSPFGERIAHGMLVLSYAVGMVPLDPERVVALRRIEDAVLKRPVHIGDTITVDAKLLRPADRRGLEAWEWRIVNQHGKLVARVTVEAVVRSEPQPEPAARAEEPELNGKPVLI